MKSAHTVDSAIVPGSAVAIKTKRSRGRQNFLCRSAAAATLCISLLIAANPARATIRYEVSVAQPSAHRFHVTMTIPDVHGSVLVQMPAWNALYQIRDFGYHVIDLRVANGPEDGGTPNSSAAQGIGREGAHTDAGKVESRPGAVTRLDKQTWRIAGEGAVRIEYGDYWDEPGPFGTQLNGEHAFINLAMVLCYVPERRGEDVQVKFTDLPTGWRVAIELPKPMSRLVSPEVLRRQPRTPARFLPTATMRWWMRPSNSERSTSLLSRPRDDRSAWWCTESRRTTHG